MNRLRTRLFIFSWKTESTSKNPAPKRRIWRLGPLPSAKHEWYIDNALDAKIAAGVVHNGEIGFYIHILWLYNSSISQSYRGFTDFGIISSGIPRLNSASVALGSCGAARKYEALGGGQAAESNELRAGAAILLAHEAPSVEPELSFLHGALIGPGFLPGDGQTVGSNAEPEPSSIFIIGSMIGGEALPCVLVAHD
jgi:hypothetical protein